MNSECNQFQQWIRQNLVGDLPPADLEALNQHVATCSACHAEHDAYVETLNRLQTYGEEPIPHHFFVYPRESEARPWQLFHRLSPFWRAATAGAAVFTILLTVAAASQMRVQTDHGALTLSFGRAAALSASDLNTVRDEILQAAEQKNRENTAALLQDLRAQFDRTRADMTQEDQLRLVAAVNTLEARLDNRIALTADDIRTGTQKSMAELYQLLSQQQDRNLATISTRLDTESISRETKEKQTDAVLDTLIQVANLNLKQPGEQK